MKIIQNQPEFIRYKLNITQLCTDGIFSMSLIQSNMLPLSHQGQIYKSHNITKYLNK